MDNMAAAQRAYDRQLPPEFDEPERDEFNGTTDTQLFISDFAATTGDAQTDLENMGVRDAGAWTAEILRNLCRAWEKDQGAVHKVCGTAFWSGCKVMAYEYYERRGEA